MGVLKAESAYAFSGFSGQLLFNGEPASNAKIIRKYRLQSSSDEQEDSVTTNNEGHFSFDSIAIKHRTPLFSSHDFLSHQDVIVEYQGENYDIWLGGKTEPGEYTEFGGKPKNLRCELTEQSRRVKHELAGVIATNCKWDID